MSTPDVYIYDYNYSVDYRHVRDALPTLPNYSTIEATSLDHCQKGVPQRPHIPIRFVGVVPRGSKYAVAKGTIMEDGRRAIVLPNCVNSLYMNCLFFSVIEGIESNVWSVIEPEN